ncbi:cupin domain-containing protein [Chloroflexota bacterium]
MEIFKIEEYLKMENPTPGTPLRRHFLTAEQKAVNIGGLCVVLAPGEQVDYHYHEGREAIFIAISGEGTEIIEGEEFTIKTNDILYIPAGEKHGTINKSDGEFRFLEFYTCTPGVPDRILADIG